MLSKATRILVVMGGWSPEREVSLASGGAVLGCLTAAGYEARGYDLPAEGSRRRAVAGLLAAIEEHRTDIVRLALHGPFGEDGTIQGLLDLAAVPYTGSGVLASALGLDKVLAKQVMVAARITAPRHVLLPRGVPPPPAPPIALPVIVKPRALGSSLGVSLVERGDEFAPAVERASAYGQDVMVEAWVAGHDIQACVLDGEILPLIEVVPRGKIYDFEAKYSPGGAEHRVPAPLPKKQYEAAQKMGLAAYRALGCAGAARVELIAEDTGTLYALEVNTVPGMTPTSLLPEAAREAGMSFLDLLERELTGALRRGAAA